MNLRRKLRHVLLRLARRFSPRPLFHAAAVSDTGRVRKNNEDAYLLMADRYFAAVADGMGGGEHGELASRWICDAFMAMFTRAPRLAFRARVERTEEELQAANARIRAFARAHGVRMMGSTAALLMADPADPQNGIVAHVGDSRIYRWRANSGCALTIDHTVGTELGRALSPAAARAELLTSRQNPLTHILTRAVGTEMRARPDWRKIDIFNGDRYLLCTDGVHDVLTDDEISDFLGRAATPQQALAALSQAVRDAGAPDNFTMVCIFVSRRRSL